MSPTTARSLPQVTTRSASPLIPLPSPSLGALATSAYTYTLTAPP